MPLTSKSKVSVPVMQSKPIRSMTGSRGIKTSNICVDVSAQGQSGFAINVTSYVPTSGYVN